MEEFPNMLMSTSWAADYRFRECQQPGADFQIGLFCRFQVDVEANLVFLYAKSDHSVVFHKLFAFANCEDWTASQARQFVSNTSLPCFSDERHMASLRFASILEVPYLQCPRVDGFSFQTHVQRALKRILSDRAVNDRAACVLKRPFRPLHKLRKVKKKGGLDAIFIRRARLRRYRQGAAQLRKHDERHQ